MEHLVQSVSKSDSLTAFFDRLWDPEKLYWQLFFTHLDILLIPMPIENVEFPFLPWVSPNYTARVEKPLETTAALSVARRDVSVSNFNVFGSELADQLRDLTLFYLIKFVRSNPLIQELINSGDLNFTRVKDTVGNSKGIKTDIFDELASLKQVGEGDQIAELQAKDVPTTDRELASVIAGLSSLLITFFTKPEAITSMAQAMTWDTMLPLHRYFNQYLMRMLDVLGLHLQNYSDILMEMFNWDLIKTMHGAFWCMNERHTPFVLASTSQLTPALYTIKCPTCNQKLILSVYYSLDPIIYEAIKFKDGLLAVAMAHLLSKSNAKYCFGYKINGGEIDFLCESPKGKVVFETKVHRQDVDQRQMVQTLRQDLLKLVNQLKLLLDSGETLLQAYLLINLNIAELENTISTVMKNRDVREKLSALPCEVKIIGPLELKSALREFKII